MIDTTTELSQVLLRLREVCRNAHRNYRDAAQLAYGHRLKSTLHMYELQRAAFGAELGFWLDKPASGAVNLLLHPMLSTSAPGNLNLVRALERMEMDAIQAYQRELELPLPGNVRHLLERHRDLMIRARDRLRMLAREYKLAEELAGGRRTRIA